MHLFNSGLQNFRRLDYLLEQKTKESESQIIPFAGLSLLLYFFYNCTVYYQTGFHFSSLVHPEVLILSIGLLVKNYWPKSLKPFFSWYWFASLFYLMPFLMTQLFLQHQDSVPWMLVELAMALVLALLLDWITYLDLLALGLFSSFVIYGAVDEHSFPSNLLQKQFLLIFCICILIALFLLRARNVAQKEHLRTLNLVSAVMAHELRTPLLSMRSSVLAMKKYLPQLIRAYQIALKHDGSIEPIRDDRMEALQKAGDEMSVSLNYSAMVIDALVAGFNNTSVIVEFSSLDLSQAIMSAIEQYPFTAEEINLVELLESPNLKIVGNEAIFVHIFHNLFKYALFRIKEIGKGDIKIWVEKKSNKATIYLECNAQALAPSVVDHIFEISLSDKERLMRIGTCLYLSKAAVERMGGVIVCENRKDSFVFALTFRLADYV